MLKRNKIIYWAATIWMAVAFLIGGVAQLARVEQAVNSLDNLGFPHYFLSILGVWKILGVIAILLPKTPLLKEWAYAGFFFVITGAIITHITMGDPAIEIATRVFLLIIIIVSWFYRPQDKKINLVTGKINE